MSTTTRRERTERGTMTHYYDGHCEEAAYSGFLWACDGCGRVWERRHAAEGCDGRGHPDYYIDTYWGKVAGQDGRPVPVSTSYTRRAVRREPVLPEEAIA